MLEVLDLYAEIAANTLERHQQVAELALRDATLTAVNRKSEAILARIQGQVEEIEGRAATLEVRQLARFLSGQVQDARSEPGATPRNQNRQEPGPDAGHPFGLSDRELEVLICIWEGLSDKQIGRKLGISRFTVAKHVGAVIRKMNVQSRTQASVIAERDALYRVPEQSNRVSPPNDRQVMELQVSRSDKSGPQRHEREPTRS